MGKGLGEGSRPRLWVEATPWSGLMWLANGRGHIFNPGRSQAERFVQLLTHTLKNTCALFMYIGRTTLISLTSPFLARELRFFPNLVHSPSVFFSADCHFRSALINLSLSCRLPTVPSPSDSTLLWACVCSFPQFRFWFK